MLARLVLHAQMFAWEASGIVTAKQKCAESNGMIQKASCKKYLQV